jgi:hypothetical protein
MHNNYEIKYSISAENSLYNFIDYMEQNCIYRWTWLFSEDIIVENYINDVRKFITEFKNQVKEEVHKWVFWQIEEKTETYEITKLVIFLRSYNITLNCVRWLKENTFVIENLVIRT